MKKILFVYPSMIIGGSTTALLSLLSNLTPDKYEIDLQLFRNEGPLFDVIPSHVNILPAAEKYAGKKGKFIKLSKFLLSGCFLKALYRGIFVSKSKTLSSEVMWDFKARRFTRKNPKLYDYAISFLEGGSNNYLAYNVKAKKKYAWLHATFASITKDPKSQIPWMKRVDKLVFVTDACAEHFKQTIPSLAEKSIVIQNITDSNLIRQRSLIIDEADEYYAQFSRAEAFKIVTASRLDLHIKGLDRIILCAKSLKEQGERFIWYIIGEGAGKARLEELIASCGVEEYVYLIGKRMNPFPFIAKADITCLTSRFEGKPMVITESMILGTPPVVTEYLAAHEQIKNGTEGVIVSNTDDAIKDGILSCIRDREMLASMSNYLKQNEYGNSCYIKEIEEVLFE